MQLISRGLYIALVFSAGWLTFTPQVQAHTGEGFHPEKLWALLRTTLVVVLAASALIGALWLYGRAKSKRKL
ncbi:MAG: hypothetical protein HY671_00180 [Chloroflexi bacterium]|nr:hypothetical protein [Chloroflexota bacterium]